MCTACWRGYVATYSLLDDHLFLKDLGINLIELKEDGRNVSPSTGPEINGITPLQDSCDMVYNTYENVNLPLELTGGILVAKDFIQELYIHMGFHEAWKYEVVHELIFQDGKLTDSLDVSDKLADVRNKLAKEPLGLDGEKWIFKNGSSLLFRLDYNY
jgi:hypothetical protein